VSLFLSGIELEGGLNRIYQGRVAKVELLKKGEDPLLRECTRDEGEQLLWNFHALFQDAVNYYLVALGSLADPACSKEHRLIRDLRERLEAAWERFPRQLPAGEDAKSLRDSVAPWLGLSGKASLEEAFKKILEGNRSKGEIRALALEELFHFCSGDGKIQQEGRSMLPRFCISNYLGNFNTGETASLRAFGKDRLSSELHTLSTDAELRAFASELEMGWVVNVSKRGKLAVGEAARVRLLKSVAHFGQAYGTHRAEGSMGNRVAEFLENNSSYRKLLLAIEAEIKGMNEDLLPEIPPNARSIPDRLEACLLFKYFPSAELAELVKLSFPFKEKKTKAKATGGFDRFGEDAIKIARGARGYVFPAFTALEQGNPAKHGTPHWKEFDIAAFKEALKALNQFGQKTEEREADLRRLEARLEYMLVADAEWKVSKSGTEEEEETAPPKLAGDDRFDLGKELLEELGDALVEGSWGITKASLRGYGKIKEQWNKLPEGAGVGEFEKVVAEAQRNDPDGMGSAPLFYALCNSKYHPLWHDMDESSWNRDFAKDMLYAFCDLNKLEADIERKKEPVNLTPAEPKHSRRLFMFSDLTGVSKVVYSESAIDVSLARVVGGVLKEQRVRVHFSAPRLRRDELLGDASCWLQPMMKALGLEDDRARRPFKSAVSLMPDFNREGRLRLLLNFPVDLDTDWLQKGIGKEALWKGQFNGVQTKSIHLHWPGTATAATLKNPWWINASILEKGFTALGCDMGQRMACAWALAKITPFCPDTKRPVRSVGIEDDMEWFAEILKTGALRLPGENAKGQCGQNHGNEGLSKRGRTADQSEYDEAIRIARTLGMDKPGAAEGWVGANAKNKSFPQQNSALIRLANRRLSRLGTYHRWSCLPDRNEKRLKATIGEVGAYGEHADLLALLEGNRLEEFRDGAGKIFSALREELREILLAVAERTVPLRGKKWTWSPRNDGTPYGKLVQTERGSDTFQKKVRYQGGLSIERIEQVEGLRKLFLRYNRSMDRNPGEPAKFGAESRDLLPGEPCPDLLRKLDHLKQERVNLTAHLVLAQALGLRLRKNHALDPAERNLRDLHGEYEPIEGRMPVDFIVMEDLGRYRTSQRRAPGENARLMNWSHRAVLDKVKMLAEPFGIPVLEIPAGYSSRFNAATGMPGSRCMEVPGIGHYAAKRIEKDCERALDPKEVKKHPGIVHAPALLGQLKQLSEHNDTRQALPPLTLLVPRIGGPLFLSAKNDSPVQADTNAAGNLALRAVAAPGCIDIHRRIRATHKAGKLVPTRGNKREKAAFAGKDKILVSSPEKKLKDASNPNFFHDLEGVGSFDRGVLQKTDGQEFPVISGIAWHSAVREVEYARCVEVNNHRLEKWGLPAQGKDPATTIDPEDDIPFNF